ncbi:hypothetical protein [Streptomyces flavofungini]|uniref:hypothetical protein n=1 Tax=Streptomyces flavofungini TaxID=68200 RepID=UPI0034DF69D5
MPDEYVLTVEASGEVTPAEVQAATGYARALGTPPSAEAAAYMRGRLANRARSVDPANAEEAEE